MTDIIWGSTKKPVVSQRLAQLIDKAFPEPGVLYLGYPVLSAAEGVNSIDALWVSPKHGVIIFDLVEGKHTDGYEALQDELANNLETKFRSHKSLMLGRTLLAPPVVVTYAPRVKADPTEGYLLTNDEDLVETLQAIHWDQPTLFESVHSVIQSISSIRRGRRRRTATKEQSRGAYLKALEDSVANLDSLQSRAVIETVEGVQRIRGLAGSTRIPNVCARASSARI